MRIWILLLSLMLITSSAVGLIVLSGGGRNFRATSLEARLVIQDFPIPDGFGIDPNSVAEFMAEKLKQRMEDDIAMRLTLKADATQKVKDIVLPRLMNVVVVREMMREIPELSAILDIGEFRHSVTGQISTDSAVKDVTLTVPGALLAEVNGEKIEVTTTSTGMTALVLGEIVPGQIYQVTIWLGARELKEDFGKTIRIGAEKGIRGRVLLWGEQDWFGSDLEALRWSRWLVGAVLACVLIFGVAILMLSLLKGWGRVRQLG